uniref:Uncharacterized protein n=1 Tax=Arundo donax TaxID=35708 RepID=A0A0A9G5E1_ARUDO
MLPTCPGRIRI